MVASEPIIKSKPNGDISFLTQISTLIVIYRKIILTVVIVTHSLFTVRLC